MKYPNKCSRCGACCLFETCMVARLRFNVSKTSKCPALVFNKNIATCLLSDVIPIGDGCCIKARAYKNGIEYNFADLNPKMKVKAVKQIKKEK